MGGRTELEDVVAAAVASHSWRLPFARSGPWRFVCWCWCYLFSFSWFSLLHLSFLFVNGDVVRQISAERDLLLPSAPPLLGLGYFQVHVSIRHLGRICLPKRDRNFLGRSVPLCLTVVPNSCAHWSHCFFIVCVVKGSPSFVPPPWRPRTQQRRRQPSKKILPPPPRKRERPRCATLLCDPNNDTVL